MPQPASVMPTSMIQELGAIGTPSNGARTTAADVKGLADALAVEAENLQGEVRRFLADVQVA